MYQKSIKVLPSVLPSLPLVVTLIVFRYVFLICNTGYNLFLLFTVIIYVLRSFFSRIESDRTNDGEKRRFHPTLGWSHISNKTGLIRLKQTSTPLGLLRCNCNFSAFFIDRPTDRSTDRPTIQPSIRPSKQPTNQNIGHKGLNQVALRTSASRSDRRVRQSTVINRHTDKAICKARFRA